jgi:hypothetical protein
MRLEVIELGKLGPLPSSNVVLRGNLQGLVGKYADLISSIQNPVTDEEARVLVTIFGPDDCFGMEWSLVGLVESAPGWPLEECLQDTSNEWIQLLRTRVEKATRRPPGR